MLARPFCRSFRAFAKTCGLCSSVAHRFKWKRYLPGRRVKMSCCSHLDCFTVLSWVLRYQILIFRMRYLLANSIFVYFQHWSHSNSSSKNRSISLKMCMTRFFGSINPKKCPKLNSPTNISSEKLKFDTVELGTMLVTHFNARHWGYLVGTPP